MLNPLDAVVGGPSERSTPWLTAHESILMTLLATVATKFDDLIMKVHISSST